MMTARLQGDIVDATRIEGGYISPDVSRGLAEFLMTSSFFARLEVDGWLADVADRGAVVNSMSDVPADLRRLLLTDSYKVSSENALESNLAPQDLDRRDQ